MIRAFNHHRRMVRDYNESVYAPCPLTEAFRERRSDWALVPIAFVFGFLMLAVLS